MHWGTRLAALCVACTAVACGPGGGSTSTDSCPGGERDLDIDTLSIVSKQNGANIELNDGDVVPMVFGAQGSSMLIVGLRVTGRDVPDCVVQQTSAETPTGDVIDDEFRSMNMHREVDGSWVTGQILLIMPGFVQEGDAVIMRGAMSRMEVQRLVYINRAGLPPRADAGPRSDAGPEDAAVPDAGVADGGAADAGADAATTDATTSDAE